MERSLVLNGTPMEETVGFARAVRLGPWISIGGTAPVDAAGRTVGIGDAAAQAERCSRSPARRWPAPGRTGAMWCAAG